jgi:phosphoglycolate phosphatase-like HAD superfamily hydrolase
MLFLFDIDGTLLSGATATHAEALHRALNRVHGIDADNVRSPLAPAGRTDGEIARAILLAAGVSARRIDERADAVRDECCRIYAELSTEDLSRTVLPGVKVLLEWLSGREDVKLALVTGNFEPIARLKLKRAGLGRHFQAGQGAFGSDSEDRVSLPPLARRRAGVTGHPHPREETLLIGDTTRDIVCARSDGVRCFAVATGPVPAGELMEADGVAADAAELSILLQAVLDT